LDFKKFNSKNNKTIFIDIIYKPARSIFLKEAKRIGFKKIFNGLDMNSNQAALAIKKVVKIKSNINKILNFF